LNHFHAKTLAGTVLYGLPMTRVRVTTRPPTGTSDTESEGPALESGPLRRISATVVRAAITATIGSELLTRCDPPQCSPQGSYFSFKDRNPRAEAGEPVQPRFGVQVLEAVMDGQSHEPRGVLWLGGRYHDVPGFQPHVRRAGVMGGPEAPEGGASTASLDDEADWQPAAPVVLRTLPRTRGVGTVLGGQSEGRLLYTVGQYRAATERLYDQMVVAVYYCNDPQATEHSSCDDRQAPEIAEVVVESTGGKAQLTVATSDPSGIAAAYATWTVGDGTWQSKPLAPGTEPGTWRAEVPAGVAIIVQVVDGAGNVAARPHPAGG